MRTVKMSAQVLNYMQILEIEDLSRVPLMKTVRERFLKLSKIRHPDKGVGSAADFAELLEVKEFLFNHIKISKVNKDIEDQEENLVRKEYEAANIEKINSDSVTGFVLTSHMTYWREVLERNFGPPILLPTKHADPPLQ